VTDRCGRALGVDAAGRHGWIGVVIDASGFVGAWLGSLRDLIAWAEPIGTVGVDIPLGHGLGDVRRADLEARRFVGPRRSSVFAAPPAEALRATSYAEANADLAARGASMLSRQAWALIPKMLEAAELARQDERVFEVHPEVSFCELNGKPLPWAKKSWNGLLLRRRLLAGTGVSIPDVVPDIGGCAADDVVDAAVAAWSAARISAGIARTLPDPPEECDGRRVAIWC
jgi:predicted RNase H-like nuclease